MSLKHRKIEPIARQNRPATPQSGGGIRLWHILLALLVLFLIGLAAGVREQASAPAAAAVTDSAQTPTESTAEPTAEAADTASAPGRYQSGCERQSIPNHI